MKVIAKYKDYSFDKDNNTVVSFTIGNQYMQQILELSQNDKFIELKVTDRVAQKSARQNRAVWQLITMIVEKQDGVSTKENMNELYCQLIRIAGIKIHYLQGLTELYETLDTFYRVVDKKERRVAKNGNETYMYECYRGLSQFNTEETNRFIEVILDYSNRLGLPVTLESEELRSLLK